MIVLIIAHATDAGAASVALRLTSRLGIGNVVTLRPESMGVLRWSHRVDGRGRAKTQIALPGRAPIACHEIGAVFNRIRYLPLPKFARSSPKDRDYAGAEMQALVVSWLAALGDRVVNPVHRHPWVTPSVSRLRWASVAADHRLPVARRVIDSRAPWQSDRGDALACDRDEPARGSDEMGVLVAGGTAVGALAHVHGERCVDTAHTLGLPLAQFRFAWDGGTTCLVDVEPLPTLDSPAAITAVCGLLTATHAMEHAA